MILAIVIASICAVLVTLVIGVAIHDIFAIKHNTRIAELNTQLKLAAQEKEEK